jgi:parvulin-like peptidyl-prolyl isomerase
MRKLITESAYVSTKEAELEYRLAETKLNVEYLKFDPQKIEMTVTPDEVAKFLADEKNKAKVKEYFDANAKEFNQPEQIKARHILVQYKGARNAAAEAQKRDKDAARKRAEELAAKAKTGDFEALAKASTDEPAGKTKGGDLGWFSADAMDKQFSDAAFKLAKGEVSGVVESPFGFHIIKVEDKKPAVTTTLEQAQNKIAETLIAKEKRPTVARERADKVLEELKAGKPADALLAEYKVKWEETGETGADARFLPGIGSSKEVGEALAGLAKPGDLYPHTVDVRGNLYLIRLKSRQEPDMAKFDKDKKKQMAASAAYTEGNALFTMYEKQVRADFEKKKAVRRNADYLALDQRSAKDGAAEN